MSHKEQFDFLAQLAKGLAQQFGPQCEIAIHDLTHGYENTIAAIENGHVTGRTVGDNASEIVLEALKDPERARDKLSYLTRTADGRLLKSSSIYLRDGAGKLTALLSINYDITVISHAATVLEQMISMPEKPKEESEVETIVSNVNDLLDNLIQESCEYVGKPVALMTKEDKIKAIHYLDGKGAFLIKKSGDKVSKFYDISKYTLYNYMDTDLEPKG